MELAVSTQSDDRVESNVKELARFIPLIEEAVAKIKEYDTISNDRLKKSEEYFSKQLQDISKAIEDLRLFTTESGAARLRLLAERLIQESKDHLDLIREETKKFQTIAQDECVQLQRVAENATDWVADAVKSLRIDHIRHLIFENVNQIERASVRAQKRVGQLVRWFHWEKVGLALVVSIVVAFLTALFVNDELPWETHKQVSYERRLGAMLEKAWPKLSLHDKQQLEIASNMSEYV